MASKTYCVREILETERIGKPQSREIMSRLEKDAESNHTVPTYSSEQEKVLQHTVKKESEFLNDRLGQVQVEVYGDREIEAVGDRFIIESYFPESSYD